jgi:tRNA threonylcarbamoyl adenosine modification protein (Sua5/YciO/YrdC/YwlC family)
MRGCPSARTSSRSTPVIRSRGTCIGPRPSSSRGGLVCYPTDTYFGIGCDLFQKKASERLALLKRRDPHKPFAFLCADLGEVSRYAIVDNEKFRLLRRILPGPYTVVLPATRVVPRTALTRQRTVGIRVPDAPVAIALVKSLGRPLATTSAGLPGEEPLVDAAGIRDQLGHGVDLILDGGLTLNEPSTVLDLSGPTPEVLRQGKGSVEGLFR